MMTDTEFFQVFSMTKQLAESTRLMNSTVSPQVFFGRLHFSLDILLALVNYEYQDCSIFPENLPSKEFNSLVEHLGETVDAFIDRALFSEKKKLEKLKTYKGQFNHFEKFMISLITAFDCADGYWPGNQLWPHFSGPLYTDDNYQRVQQLYDQLDELYDPIVQSEIESITSKRPVSSNTSLDNDDLSHNSNCPAPPNTSDFSGSFLHIAGLPLLIGTFCKVSHFPDHLEISSPKYKHYLATDRIADTAILSYKELKKLHSDLTKSVATSAAFMTLGEAIDISAKKKHLSPSTRFFLIAYRDIEEEPQSIIFQLNDGNLQDAMKFTSGATKNTRPRIDL